MTQDNPKIQAEAQTPTTPAPTATPATAPAPAAAPAAVKTDPQVGVEKDLPLTPEELAARRDEIVARVKALGWRPFQDVALDVLGRVVAAADGFLAGLEGGKSPRKKG